MIDNIYDQLKRDEGFRPNIYIDTVGKRTIGYGHNLDANPFPITTVTEESADRLLRSDVNVITNSLVHHLPWTYTLLGVYLGVLQNMSFNMGIIGLIGFHNTLTHLQNSRFDDAASDMESSKWYTEVGDRAKRLVQQMRAGQWV